MKTKLIDAYDFQPDEIKRAYDARSRIYSKTVARWEYENHLLALEKAAIQPDDKVLEVAVGPGLTLLEILKRVDRHNIVYGVDISPEMLYLAEERANQAGFANIALFEGNARDLPFDDSSFDVLYNGYMLDLIPLAELPGIIQEFKRLLKPNGRLVLLNMSKKDGSVITLREKLFRWLPAKWVLYLAGGCRPVLMEEIVIQAGFHNVIREYIDHASPSEIVIATK